MRPVVLYVDDQPQNLTVFEAALPESWQIITFADPMKALKQIGELKPWVILSDQRMPSVSGVEFLEITQKILPNTVRIIVTGYSDEDLIIESVRKAKIFDYIRKPWDADDLEASIQRAIDYYYAVTEKDKYFQELETQKKQLQEKNIELVTLTNELEKAKNNEREVRKELECWVPPFVLWALKENNIKFPMSKDIVGLTFDIIQSGQMHDVQISGKPLRSLVIQRFSESIIRNGGWRESHAGDSAYGHFGLLEDLINPYDAALAAAREFRVALRSLSKVNDVDVECGIALHLARNCKVDVHTVNINTPKGSVVQKSFDTTSTEIDCLHRIERMVHGLPGTNIIMTDEFIKSLSARPLEAIELGYTDIRGQKDPLLLHLIPSDFLEMIEIEFFIKKYFHDKVSGDPEKKAA